MPGWLKKIFGFLPGGFGDIASIIGGITNYRQQERANETNLQMVRMQNQAAAQESEKAYQRSRASSQVADMMSAGMSKAGALNAINGGGSYQPAPVNAGQVQAPQLDTSTIVNALQAGAQLKEQKRQFDLQHAENKRQFNENLNLEKSKFQETANQNAAIRNLWHEESEAKKVEKKLLDLRFELETANKDNKISSEKAELIAKESRSLLEDIKNQKAKVGWDNLPLSTIEELSKIQATLEVMGHFGTTKLVDIIDWIHDVLDSLPFS